MFYVNFFSDAFYVIINKKLEGEKDNFFLFDAEFILQKNILMRNYDFEFYCFFFL